MTEFDYKQRPFARRISQAEWDSIFPTGKASAKPTILASTPATHNPDVSRPENTVSVGSGSGLLASCNDISKPPCLCGDSEDCHWLGTGICLKPCLCEAFVPAYCGCGEPMMRRGNTLFCTAPLCHGAVAL